SLCISSRVTETPRRARRRASIAPHGPPPTTQQEVVSTSRISSRWVCSTAGTDGVVMIDLRERLKFALCRHGEMLGLRPPKPKASRDLAEHGARDLRLKPKHLAAFKIVFTRPQLGAIRDVSEIDDDAAPVAGLQNTPVYDVAQAQLRCGLANR